MKLSRFAVILSSAVLLAPAIPAEAEPPMLAQNQLDPAHFLPPPPAAGSPRTVAELAELRQYQATATPEQLTAAAYDDRHEDATVFAAALGPAFDPAKLPATTAMVQTISDAEEAASNVAKKEFHRDRPWIVDPTIKTCTPHKPGPAATSYPSGHATVGFAIAIVLATLIPEKSQAILARASEYAENRLVCGYHFRSDIVAGQQFGTVLTLDLMQSAQFRQQMAATKAELQAAHIAR